MPEFKKKIYGIDVPSVCNLKRNSNGKPMIKIFDRTVENLNNLGIPQTRIIGFSDCNFQYYVDNIKHYKNLIRSGLIIEMPAGIKADKAIIAYCLKHEDAVYISQDLFREYYKYLPYNEWILERRICLVLVNDELFLIPMADEVNKKPIKEKEYPKGYTLKSLEFKKKKKPNKDTYRTTIDVLQNIEETQKDSKWDLFGS